MATYIYASLASLNFTLSLFSGPVAPVNLAAGCFCLAMAAYHGTRDVIEAVKMVNEIKGEK